MRDARGVGPLRRFRSLRTFMADYGSASALISQDQGGSYQIGAYAGGLSPIQQVACQAQPLIGALLGESLPRLGIALSRRADLAPSATA